jgi:hypothetical protein
MIQDVYAVANDANKQMQVSIEKERWDIEVFLSNQTHQQNKNVAA